MRTATPFTAPSAVLPLLMSGAATALLAYFVLTYGIDPSAPPHDEMAPARIWQLLMGLQLPVILWFAATWLPRDPRRAAGVLLVQILAAAAAAFPVFYLGI